MPSTHSTVKGKEMTDKEKRALKNALAKATNCMIQHDGWPCGTCFFALSKELTNQDWQALLLVRGDYNRMELTNLPENINDSIEKILFFINERSKNAVDPLQR